MTNGDKIFKAVIEDSALISYGGYNLMTMIRYRML